MTVVDRQARYNASIQGMDKRRKARIRFEMKHAFSGRARVTVWVPRPVREWFIWCAASLRESDDVELCLYNKRTGMLRGPGFRYVLEPAALTRSAEDAE